jgi:hypothetical protein
MHRVCVRPPPGTPRPTSAPRKRSASPTARWPPPCGFAISSRSGRIRTRRTDSTDATRPAAAVPRTTPWFDYTILGEGSLLSAIHDLPGFDAQINEYRSFLLEQQDPGGSWDAGDSQITAFVVMGLAAVGATGANSAIALASEFFLSNELPAGGWPATVTESGSGVESIEVDGEVVQAMATLFSTPAGADVSVMPSQLSTVSFSSVAGPVSRQ